MKTVLRLFVTGMTPRSEQAVENVLRICEQKFAGEYELSVIDVLEDPLLAEQERVFATPMLIRELPLPRRRIVGDLTNERELLSGLDVSNGYDLEGRHA